MSSQPPAQGAAADAAAPNAGPDAGADRGRAGAAGTVLGLLALVVALFAAAAGGFSWWQNAQRYAALAAGERDALAEIRQGLETVRSEAQGTSERVAALEAARDDADQRAAALAAKLESVPGRVGALEQRVEAGTGSSDARSEWLRSEAQYYLALANTELSLGGRWQTAISALELADDRLRQLAAPSLAPVRAAVAAELRELKSVKLPDIEGTALRLGDLADHVADLPLRHPGPPGGGPAPAKTAQTAAPGLGRLWLTVKGALGGIVRVEHPSAPAAQALTDEERALARRQLRLELQLARASALEAEPEAFGASLRNALGLLDRDYDGDSPAVANAVTLLTQLEAVDVAPRRPDISASLELLERSGGAD